MYVPRRVAVVTEADDVAAVQWYSVEIFILRQESGKSRSGITPGAETGPAVLVCTKWDHNHHMYECMYIHVYAYITQHPRRIR